ncbi:MAG: class I mannose-6-phosphate isomerase [Prevotella sp.]|nr:class I mannose-6-phosphate isomerase [Bacteroides sp.]MCM1365916.1 class I mannose-6-phosphate isomerase [Prevotella sp.]MCM1436663.1 class I mannose-6-phosphate isomerase [Prevotella sp.]
MWTFDPVFKETIWGGHRIIRFKDDYDASQHISIQNSNIGESWEISDLPGSESIVASGIDKGKTLRQLIEQRRASLLGERNFLRFGTNFPLLVKFIDAAQDLSVQVHPDAASAQKLGYRNGKTEMWYVIDSDKGSFLINGLNRPINPDHYDRIAASEELLDHLNYIDVNPGDAFFIPSGRIHALGAGTFVCEIQESSDLTFRLYDYHRKGVDGKERELHTREAFNIIKNKPVKEGKVKYTPLRDVPVTLVSSPFFTTNLLKLDQETIRDYSEWDTFVILIATNGKASISSQGHTIELRQGHSVLIPASAPNVVISPDGDFTALETYIK